jgi:VanZ family protein
MARKRAPVNSKHWTTTALILWVVVVFFMHVLPIDADKARSITIPHFDKAVHFSLFFLLAILAVRRYLKHNDVTEVHRILRIALMCCAYGIVLELAQPLAGTNRSSDVADGIADALGVVAGTFSFKNIRALFLLRH